MSCVNLLPKEHLFSYAHTRAPEEETVPEKRPLEQSLFLEPACWRQTEKNAGLTADDQAVVG